MGTEFIGRNVAELVDYARQKGWYSYLGDTLFGKAGNVSNLGGAINVVYGAVVYDQLNREANVHAVLKKEPWDLSGFRVTTDSGGPSAAPTGLYGGADPGSVGTVIDVGPTELDSIPGFPHTPWDLTLDAGFRAQHDDGLDIWEWKTAKMRDIHAQGLNTELMRSAEAEANAIGTNNTTDAKNDSNGNGVGIESLDRLISSDAEEDDTAGTGTGHYDVYEGDVDRDSGTTFDAQVFRPDGSQGTFGGNLTWEITGLEDCFDATEQRGQADRDSQIVLTARDAYRAFVREFKTFGRFDVENVQAKLDYNGLSQTATHPGSDISFTLRAYEGRPWIVDRAVPSNGTTVADLDNFPSGGGGTGISHQFVVDQRHLHLKVGFPTMYVDADNAILRGQFDTKALYLTAEQAYATRFNCHGKVRSGT